MTDKIATVPMRLYSGPLSMFGAKAEIAALEKGLDVEVTMVPFHMARLYDPKHPEVERINPKRQVPVLCMGMWSYSIRRRSSNMGGSSARSPLWPRDIAGRARARQIEHLRTRFISRRSSA